MIRWKQGLAGFLLKGLIICVSFLGVFALTFRLNENYLQGMADTVTVAAARMDLLPGAPLLREQLAMAERPAFGLGEDYIADMDEFFGNGPWYVGDIGFGAGDIVRPGRLVPASRAGGEWRWEFDKSDRARLIAVETSLVRSSGDWLWPGMLVDALVYIPPKDGYDDPQPSRIIGPEEDPLLKSLLVIDKKNANGLAIDGLPDTEGYGRDRLPAVVTLMIGEDETERAMALVRYNEEGKIYFSPTADR